MESESKRRTKSARSILVKITFGVASLILVWVVVSCALKGTYKVSAGKKGLPDHAPARKDTSPPRPTVAQINEVLSGSLALVEAQYTFYTHVMVGERFAASVKELDFRSNQGAVMVSDVWHASDAVEKPVPVKGYLFKSTLMTRKAGEKDGFVISAFPADEKADWPLFLSIVPNNDGSIIGMSGRDTWEITDPKASSEIRSIFTQDKVNEAGLERWSPTRNPASTVIKNFRKKM